MKNSKKIILGTGLMLAGVCSANANNLFQVEELGSSSEIQASTLGVDTKTVEAFRFQELCCGYGMHLSPKEMKKEARLVRREEKKLERASRIAARKEVKNQKEAVATR